MTTATLDALAAPSAAESPPPPRDYKRLAEEICNNACRGQLWKNCELTTYEFRYDARRTEYKEILTNKYRAQIEYHLPHFWKTHGPIRANDFSNNSSMPRFIKECAACFAYLIALEHRNSTALSFDNDTDKLWAKRNELEEVEERIEELQDELSEAEDQQAALEREIEAAEKAEAQKGGE